MNPRYGIAEWYGLSFPLFSGQGTPSEFVSLRDDDGNFRLSRGHWEVLTLEDTTRKLLAAETIRREAFEQELRSKLEALR